MTDQPQNVLPNNDRGLARAFIGGIAVTLVAVLLGGVAFAALINAQRLAAVPAILPADTQLYAGIKVNLRDLPNVQRIREAFPSLFDDQSMAPSTTALEELLDVDFSTEIAPWIGQELAVALRDLPSADLVPTSTGLEDLAANAEVMFLLASRDDPKAQIFLDSLLEARRADGHQISEERVGEATLYRDAELGESPVANFVLVHHYLVFSNRPEALIALAQRTVGGADTLQSGAEFSQVSRTLSQDRVGTIYVAGGLMRDLLGATVDGGEMPFLQPFVGGMARDRAALQAVGVGLGLIGEGVQFDVAGFYDVAALTAVQSPSVTSERVPVDTELLRRAGQSTVGAFSFRVDQSNTFLIQSMFPDLQLEQISGDALYVLLNNATSGEQATYIVIRPSDSAAAATTVEEMLAAVRQGRNVEFVTEQIGEVEWQVIGEQSDKLGIAMRGDNLYVAQGDLALRAASGTDGVLETQPGFVKATADMFIPNNGMGYVDVDQINRLLFGFADAQWLDRIDALAFTGAPGVDSNGLARARMMLVIGE